MKTANVSPVIFETFSDSFRQHAHLLVAWGYQTVRPRLQTDDEEKITDLLYQGIDHVLMLEPARWCSKYEVKSEAPISGIKSEGKNRKKIDLLIVATVKGRPQYVFEAKPLNYRKPKQRSSNYTNHKKHGLFQAMGRFLEGEYAGYTARFPEVVMLGYVLSDTVEIWRDRLKQDIDAKKTELRLTTRQQDVSVIDEFPVEWISKHNRTSSDFPVEVYHILLDCKTPNDVE